MRRPSLRAHVSNRFARDGVGPSTFAVLLWVSKVSTSSSNVSLGFLASGLSACQERHTNLGKVTWAELRSFRPTNTTTKHSLCFHFASEDRGNKCSGQTKTLSLSNRVIVFLCSALHEVLDQMLKVPAFYTSIAVYRLCVPLITLPLSLRKLQPSILVNRSINQSKPSPAQGYQKSSPTHSSSSLPGLVVDSDPSHQAQSLCAVQQQAKKTYRLPSSNFPT